MSTKQRPPLTPAGSTYLGLARIAGAAPPVEARHLLRWPSRSRPGKEHHSSCDERGDDVRCTCEAWTYRGACGHAAGHLDALAHHGVTFGPPADPGGANEEKPGEHQQDCRGKCHRDLRGVWRRGCLECGLLCEDRELRGGLCPFCWRARFGEPHDPGAEAGGAVVGPPELAGLAECEDAARDARTLDDLVAAGGDRWIVGRWGARWGEAQPPASPRVTLTCAGCHRTRVFDDEAAAAAFVRADGACGCGGAGPTPPAPGAARKPVDECLLDLYGG